jgi:hypothetical protein
MRRSRHRWRLLLLLAATACAGAGRSPPGAAESPLEVVRGFYAALHRGDARDAAARVGSPGAPEALRATQAFVDLAAAYRDLEAAIHARFGPAAAQAVGYADRVAAEDQAVREAREEVTGDAAVVSTGGRAMATLRRREGAWGIVLEPRVATASGLRALVLEAQATRETAARVVPAIRQGLFDSADDALDAFRETLSVRLQGEEPDLPPGPPADAPPAGAAPQGVTL